jgi:hypothetical protein
MVLPQQHRLSSLQLAICARYTPTAAAVSTYRHPISDIVQALKADKPILLRVCAS